MAQTAELARRLQGGYYLVTGLWPVLSFRTFTLVVGPKPDRFQTQTTGLLFAAAGTALQPWRPRMYAAAPDESQAATARVLAASVGLVTAAVELAYHRQVRWIFTADAVLELAFAAAALTADRPRRSPAQGDRA